MPHCLWLIRDICLLQIYKQEKKYKQVVDFLSKNAVDASGRPYTPTRILKALGKISKGK
jgi:ribosome maturation protein Sdo1